MKIDYIQTLIAVALSALLGWGAYALCAEETQQIAMSIVVALWCLVSIEITIGISFDDHKKGVMIKTTTSSFLGIMLLCDFIFTFYTFSIPLFSIINGVLLLTMILVIRGIYKS